MRNLSSILLIICILFSLNNYAQLNGKQQSKTYLEENLFLNGILTNYYTGDILTGVSIKASVSGKTIAKGNTNGKGEFEIVLDYDKEYTVDFMKGGYITKTIIINTVGVPENKKRQCPDMMVEITLFEPSECIKEDIMPQPIGKAIYYSKKNRIDWDMNYSGPKIQALNKKLDACAEELAKAEEEKIRKEKEYLTVMKTANKAFTKKDWVTATSNYEAALQLFPEKKEPQQKLDLINTEIAKKAEAEKQRAEELARAAAEKVALAEAKIAEQKAETERLAKEKAEAEALAKAQEVAKQKELAAVASKKAEEEKFAKEQAEALAKQKAKEQKEQEAIAIAATKKAKAEKAALEKAEKVVLAEQEAAAKKNAEQEVIARKQAEEKALKEKAAAEQIAIIDAQQKEAAKKEAEAKKIAEQKAHQQEKIALQKAKEEEKAQLIAQNEVDTRAAAEQEAINQQKAAEKLAKKEKTAKETAANKALLAENERKTNEQKINAANKKIEQQAKEKVLKAKAITPPPTSTTTGEIKGRSSIKIKRKNPTRHLYKKPNKYKKGKGPTVKKRMVF